MFLPGERVLEYHGSLMTAAAADEKQKYNPKRRDYTFYFKAGTKDMAIDAYEDDGSLGINKVTVLLFSDFLYQMIWWQFVFTVLARLINHRTNGNLEAKIDEKKLKVELRVSAVIEPPWFI